jgi:hypothetical protein
MTTAKSWELSNVLTVAVKSTERCPAYLQFTSKKGESYGRVPRKICMFPETWTDFKKLESDLVEAIRGSNKVPNSWKLYPNWQVEVREFKDIKYVCFSQWDGQSLLPKFNVGRDEYQALLEISDEVDTVIEERRAPARFPTKHNPPFRKDFKEHCHE